MAYACICFRSHCQCADEQGGLHVCPSVIVGLSAFALCVGPSRCSASVRTSRRGLGNLRAASPKPLFPVQNWLTGSGCNSPTCTKNTTCFVCFQDLAPKQIVSELMKRRFVPLLFWNSESFDCFVLHRIRINQSVLRTSEVSIGNPEKSLCAWFAP